MSVTIDGTKFIKYLRKFYDPDKGHYDMDIYRVYFERDLTKEENVEKALLAERLDDYEMPDMITGHVPIPALSPSEAERKFRRMNDCRTARIAGVELSRPEGE